MSTHEEDVSSGSEIDLAIERALEQAQLRGGDGGATSTALLAAHSEPTAVESGVELGGLGDAD